MNPAAYIEMAETESRHWWFIGFRTIFFKYNRGFKFNSDPIGNLAATGTAVPLILITTFSRTLLGVEHFLLKYFNLSFSVLLLRVLKTTNEC